MTGAPKVHAYCHCEDCRNLLQVPFHSVLAWDPEKVRITRGENFTRSFQHPQKKMTRVFCTQCGEVLYNTNAMEWKLVSQLLVRKTHNDQLPESYQPSAHFFYDRRILDIEDGLPKK
ncbi:GFA family protein [Marinospirillum perlucidum]|uniref:GFA family protein n=1 Tax=Marinospirillum perlucidum TaxID=1982602 RepID=UPI000DF39F28|nr:GFA family protein [Marinospirillum perlucidum]